MDYVETFKNLRTNNKYGRKSPHKAVLMLTIIELYEQSILVDNEIFYNDTLKSMFLKVWNRVLPEEPLFHPDAYLPFWYLQNDSFWHIVPIRGKEEILSLMRDTKIKPSEAKLKESIRCAELDDDLYFLMTIASGRSLLKRALLETYTTLSEEQIDRMADSADNIIDHSIAALSEYQRIISQKEDDERKVSMEVDDGLIRQFQELNEDLQIVLNIEYFSFLKNHRYERGLFKEICPTVYDLLDKIVNQPVRQGDILPSFAFTYDNFLSDLKISLMSEYGSLGIIDKIEKAIDELRGNNNIEVDIEPINEKKVADLPIKESLQSETVSNDIPIAIHNVIPERDYAKENRKGKPWTKNEEKQLERLFQQGLDFATIAAIVGRSELAIKARLDKLGLIEYTYGQEDIISQPLESLVEKNESSNEFNINNTLSRAFILNKYGEKVFSTDGKFKYMGGNLYRLNLKKECFTIKVMLYNGEAWMKGGKKIIAYPNSKLYRVVDAAYDYSEVVEEIVDSPCFEECKLKVKGEWYNYQGVLVSDTTANTTETDNSQNLSSNQLRIIKSPQYEARKQAILRAMGFFRKPAKIKDIVRTISRSAWGATIKDKDVEEIISTISEVESIEGNFILRKNR
ncbi:MAG: hypothetical protein J5529_11655 [Prevotella sp.]|nr:hypothetical protein [Prevotella sp.]